MMNQSYKEELLNTGLFKQTPSNQDQFRCKCCPFCGDSNYHMYVLIKMTDDTPVLYNCFKCNASGVMNQKFLDYFGIENLKLPKNMGRKKLVVSNKVTKEMNMVTINEENDDIDGISMYIENRIGKRPTMEELKMFQYIGDPKKYAMEYLGHDGKKNGLFKNRYWFKLTNGNMIGRSVDGENDFRWMRFKSRNVIGRGLYSIKNPIDLYKTINVCIAEGVMDAIGLYYHYHISNGVYIASMGKDYGVGLKHLIGLGIFGDSVCVRIFKDADVDTSGIRIDPHIRKLFKRIDLYQNAIGHDYGVKEEEIEFEKIITKGR